MIRVKTPFFFKLYNNFLKNFIKGLYYI